MSRGASPKTRRQRVGQIDLDALPALGDERRGQLDRLLDHLVERHRPAADADLPRLDAHALQQVVDELRQAQAAALEREHQLLRLGGIAAVAAALEQALAQQLDRGELGGQRRLELVRDVGEHRVALAARGLDVGLVAQHLELPLLHRPALVTTTDRRRPPAEQQVLGGAGAAAEAGVDDRAGLVARPLAAGAARVEHVAAEAAERLRRPAAPRSAAACGLR